jgi:hypothetical protein
LNDKHKLLISTDVINSWREYKYCTENTGYLSVAHAEIGLEVRNEEANMFLSLRRAF